MSKRHRFQNYIMQRYELRIEEMTANGWGRGYFMDGAHRVPAEVRGAVPGDRVIVEGRRVEDSVLQCALVETLECAYPRIPCSCPHARVRCDKDTGCGGCTLREWSYETQCQIKQGILERLVRRAGLDIAVSPILPCVTQDYYRNKMELSFGPDGGDAPGVGLHPSGFRHEVISMRHCDMISPLLPELAQATTAWMQERGVPYFVFRKNAGFMRLLTLREGKRTGATMLILTTSQETEVTLADGRIMSAEAVVRDFMDAVLSRLSRPVDTFYWTVMSVEEGRRTELEDRLMAGPAVLRERMLMPDEAHALEFEVLPRAFFQPNTLQAERLYRTVLGAAEPYMTHDMPVLDLYCGTGTIALSFAIHGHRAIAVDIEKQAIANARENARKNGLEDRIEFYAGDTAEILKQLLDGDANFRDYLMVVDPPRRGLLPPAYRQIMRTGLRTIIYVSCNPESLCEDLARFKADGYDVVSVQPVDMLPQTAHLETVATLRRRG